MKVVNPELIRSQSTLTSQIAAAAHWYSFVQGYQGFAVHRSYNSLSAGSNEVTIVGSERMMIGAGWTVESGVPKLELLPAPNVLLMGGAGRTEVTLVEDRTVFVGD